MERPLPTEHIPYYEKYISLVPEDDVLGVLAAQAQEIRALAAAVSEEQGGYRYAPGKWSVREVFGHLADVERILAYRAFSIARGERRPLNGFEPDEYAVAAEADRSTLPDLGDEFASLRQGNVAMFRRLSDAAWRRIGTADGNPISARALAFIMAGHVRHHQRSLHEQYGLGRLPAGGWRGEPGSC